MLQLIGIGVLFYIFKIVFFPKESDASTDDRDQRLEDLLDAHYLYDEFYDNDNDNDDNDI